MLRQRRARTSAPSRSHRPQRKRGVRWRLRWTGGGSRRDGTRRNARAKDLRGASRQRRCTHRWRSPLHQRAHSSDQVFAAPSIECASRKVLDTVPRRTPNVVQISTSVIWATWRSMTTYRWRRDDWFTVRQISLTGSARTGEATNQEETPLNVGVAIKPLRETLCK
jgi:hypothetical protein